MTECPYCSEKLSPKVQPFKPIQLVACSACLNAFLIEWEDAGPLARKLSFFATSRWRREAFVFPGPRLVTPPNTNSLVKLTHSAGSRTCGGPAADGRSAACGVVLGSPDVEWLGGG